MKIEQNKVTKIGLVIIIILSLTVIWIYKWDNNRLKNVKNVNDIGLHDKNHINVVGEIEKVEEDGEYFNIEGWCVNKEKNDYFNFVIGNGSGIYIDNRIVLIDERNNIFEVNTIASERKDISEKINDGTDYSKCGIKARVKKKNVNGEKFKIGILNESMNGERILILSNKEISK